MESLRGGAEDLIAGLAMLILLFALREFAAGALRKAGEDAWARAKRTRKPKAPKDEGRRC